MKKLWLIPVLLLVVFGLVLTGCPEAGIKTQAKKAATVEEEVEEEVEEGTPPADPLIVDNPTPAAHGSPSPSIAADGVVSFTDDSNLVSYAFPANWDKYTTIVVTYDATCNDGADDLKGNIKTGVNSFDGISAGQYQYFEEGTDNEMEFTVAAFKPVPTGKTAGISIQMSIDDNGGGDDPSEDWELKVTKITFSGYTP